MKTFKYTSQIKAICDAAYERKLDIDEVGNYYDKWRAAAEEAYPDPKVPAVYYDFLAERETWTHFFPADVFPGKDPSFDCLMSALHDTENDTKQQEERHIKAEDDGEHFNVTHLREALQQKELLIRSKDELLGVREEALRATKELLAQKDKIIKIREEDLQHACRLVGERDQTITEKYEIISNLQASLQLCQHTISAHEETIAQKSEAVKNAKQPRKEVYIQLAKKDKAIESHKEHIERQKQTIERLNENLRVKGIKNTELNNKMQSDAARLKDAIVAIKGKDFEIGALKTKLQICVSDSVARTPKMEASCGVKVEDSEDGEIMSRSTKVKAEPMDY